MSHPYLQGPYPFLHQLLGGWFHQDWGLDGETWEQTVAEYKAVTSAADVLGAKADIETLLKNSGDDIDREFVRMFHFDPAGCGMTTRQWLTRVHDVL
jgi:hypothetical protein